jgi:hypothetical protein
MKITSLQKVHLFFRFLCFGDVFSVYLRKIEYCFLRADLKGW